MIRFYAPPPVDDVEEVELPRQVDRATTDDRPSLPRAVRERRDASSRKPPG